MTFMFFGASLAAHEDKPRAFLLFERQEPSELPTDWVELLGLAFSRDAESVAELERLTYTGQLKEVRELGNEVFLLRTKKRLWERMQRRLSTYIVTHLQERNGELH